ncbi:MAG: hypothetical protein AAFN30_04400 [Actinomycetota bacterium]
MTLLMVTPYPPYRDGIGTYAVQEVRRLRAEGRAVEVLSPLPSAAHHHLALGTLRGVLALVKRARHYETTMVQFSPEMFFGSCRGSLERVAVWLGLEALARVTELEIRQHEIEWGPLRRNPAERLAAARALRAAATVSVHTQGEVDRLVAAIGIDPARVTLVDHGRHFETTTTETQAEARAELGLHPRRHQFLAIGFLQEHKGFDRAAEAFRAAGLGGQAELHIVGSVRVNHPDLLAHARALERLAATIPGVEVHQRYVSDEEFDRWILAADTVVLPYREIWSSSVLERAKLLDRAIVAADVGGLGDQAPTGTLLFDDAESLAQCLKERAATTSVEHDEVEPATIGDDTTASGESAGWRVDPDGADRASIEAQIRRRARATGGRTGARGPSDALAPMLALAPLQRPEPVSARRGVTEVKQVLRRLVDWELEPLARQVDRLQRASTEAVARLDRSMGELANPDAHTGTSLIEDPFVHQALAEAGPGCRVLLIGGAGSTLAGALAAGGHILTVVDPTELAAAVADGGIPLPMGPGGGGHDAVVALSSATTLVDAEGLRLFEALASALAPQGRLVVAVRSAQGPSAPPSGLRLHRHRVAVEHGDGDWRVVDEADPGLVSAPAESVLHLQVLTADRAAPTAG